MRERVASLYASHLGGDSARYSRALLGVLCVLWILGQLFGVYANNVFALTPGLTLSNYYLWTLVTAGLYDSSFWMGLVNIAVCAVVAPVLERSWSSSGGGGSGGDGGYVFLKFVAVTNLAVNVALFFSMVACYAATEFEPCLFRAVCGFSGVNAAFAVALKQKFGSRSLLPGVRFLDAITFAHVPMVLGWVSLLLWALGSVGGKEAPLIFFGTFFAWVYLRFFMRDTTTGVVGDLRAEFAAASFFPDVCGIRALVLFAGTVVFQSLYRLGFFSEAVRTNASLPTSAPGAGSGAAGALPSAGSSGVSSAADVYRAVDPTAERRRLLAIKAIDDKLAELARQPNHSNSMLYHHHATTAQPLPSAEVPSGAAAAAAAQQQPLLAAQHAHDSALSPEAAASSPTAAAAAAASALSQQQQQQADAASSALVAAALPSEEELAEMEAALAQPTTAPATVAPSPTKAAVASSASASPKA